jgi:hypothetical protein
MYISSIQFFNNEFKFKKLNLIFHFLHVILLYYDWIIPYIFL